jgi:hypothetical protein
MITILAVSFGFLVAIALLLAVSRPDTFRVARTIRIDVPPDTIFPLIDDLHRHGDWSPFYRKDPAMKGTYGGPAHGPGATFDFDGNRQCGTGRVSITDSVAPQSVSMRLQMTKPVACDNAIAFTLEPKGNGTDVTWAMQGAVPLLARLVHMVWDIDGMVGRDFEAGLASLKSLAEGTSSTAARLATA